MRTSLLMMALLSLVLSTQVSTASAQGSPRVQVESDEYLLWVNGVRCRPPCTRSVGDDEVEIGVGLDPQGPSDRRIFPSRGLRLSVGRQSHADVHTAGGVVLAVGWIGGIALGMGLGIAVANGESRSCSFACAPGLSGALIGGGAALGLGILGSIIGGSLLALHDGPTFELMPTFTASEDGATLGVAGAF